MLPILKVGLITTLRVPSGTPKPLTASANEAQGKNTTINKHYSDALKSSSPPCSRNEDRSGRNVRTGGSGATRAEQQRETTNLRSEERDDVAVIGSDRDAATGNVNSEGVSTTVLEDNVSANHGRTGENQGERQEELQPRNQVALVTDRSTGAFSKVPHTAAIRRASAIGGEGNNDWIKVDRRNRNNKNNKQANLGVKGVRK